MSSILVVTRREEFLGILRGALAESDCKVAFADDCEDGVAHLAVRDWTCLLVDESLIDEFFRSVGQRRESIRSWFALALLSGRPEQQTAADLPGVVFPQLGIEHVRTVIDLAVENDALAQRLSQTARLAAVGQVVSGVLHELKTPINNLLSAVDRLDQQFLDAAGNAEWLAVVQRNAAHLRDGVQELLGGFRHDFSPQPLDLHATLDRAVHYVVKGDLSLRKIRVERHYCELPAIVSGSAGLLFHLFLNLVVNARQALSERPGAIIVRTARAGDQEIVIEVEDTGPGIALEVLDRLFRKPVTTKPDGSGFGLQFCKQIAERHGGSIAVENRAEGGARFRVCLPMATP